MEVYSVFINESFGCSRDIGVAVNKKSAWGIFKAYVEDFQNTDMVFWRYSQRFSCWIGYYFGDEWSPDLYLGIEKRKVYEEKQ